MATINRFSPEVFNHPAFLYREKVREVCRPALDFFNMLSFTYAIFYPDGSSTNLMTENKLLTYDHNHDTIIGFPKDEFFQMKPCTCYFPEGYRNNYFMSDIHPGSKLTELYTDSYLSFVESFGISDRFVIAHKTNHCLEYFIFSFREAPNKLKVMQNIDLLKRFILYFKANLKTELQHASEIRLTPGYQSLDNYQAAMTLLDKNNVQRDEFLAETAIKKYPLAQNEHHLTAREFDVLQLLSKGLGTKSTARTLNLKERTVNTHVENMKRKLDIYNREDLATLFLKEFRDIV